MYTTSTIIAMRNILQVATKRVAIHLLTIAKLVDHINVIIKVCRTGRSKFIDCYSLMIMASIIVGFLYSCCSPGWVVVTTNHVHAVQNCPLSTYAQTLSTTLHGTKRLYFYPCKGISGGLPGILEVVHQYVSFNRSCNLSPFKLKTRIMSKRHIKRYITL